LNPDRLAPPPNSPFLTSLRGWSAWLLTAAVVAAGAVLGLIVFGVLLVAAVAVLATVWVRWRWSTRQLRGNHRQKVIEGEYEVVSRDRGPPPNEPPGQP
jgi:hypothetical protein